MKIVACTDEQVKLFCYIVQEKCKQEFWSIFSCVKWAELGLWILANSWHAYIWTIKWSKWICVYKIKQPYLSAEKFYILV